MGIWPGRRKELLPNSNHIWNEHLHATSVPCISACVSDWSKQQTLLIDIREYHSIMFAWQGINASWLRERTRKSNIFQNFAFFVPNKLHLRLNVLYEWRGIFFLFSYYSFSCKFFFFFVHLWIWELFIYWMMKNKKKMFRLEWNLKLKKEMKNDSGTINNRNWHDKHEI